MGRPKDDFIEQTGGFQFGEGDPEFRLHQIKLLDEKIRSGVFEPGDQLDAALAQLRALKALPSDEFDYEPADDGE